MIYQSLVEYGIEDKVEIVVSKNEYVAQSAIDFGCDYLIRGIRSAVDFDYESLIQKANTEVLDGAKTIFVMPPRDLESVSSSFIKNLVGPVGWHWNIKKFVSNAVYDALIKKYLMRCISKYTGLHLNEGSLNELTETIIDNYYDTLKNPLEAKYKKSKEASKIYQKFEEEYAPVNIEILEKCRSWIKQHIFSIDKLVQIDLGKKDYLKIFFEVFEVNLLSMLSIQTIGLK